MVNTVGNTDRGARAAAMIAVAQGEFRVLRGSSNPELAAEAVLARLDHVRAELTDAAGRFCPDGENAQIWMERYGDGRTDVSAMPIGGVAYAHCWHPHAGHPMNKTGELHIVTTPDGARRRIIVSAPGHLDAVTLTATAEASDSQQALAQTE